MKKEKSKQFIHWCTLGAIGGIFMAAGDWLLGCIPLQQTDTGLFNRAYYLSGSYGLWKPVLTVGLGAVGGFLYYFVVKALNADIDTKYRKTTPIWGRVSERRPPSQRSQPIRMTCSPQSSPCMFRCYWFSASIS